MYGFGDYRDLYSIGESYDFMAERHGVRSKTAFGDAEFVIDAVMELEAVVGLAAALTIETKSGIPDDDVISNDKLALYQDFIDTVYSVIVGEGFPIVRERQSNESYSYYVDFLAPLANGEELHVIRVRFRISNHGLSGGGDSIGRTAFKSFVIGGEKYSNTFELVGGVTQICQDIKRGDYMNWSRL